MHSLTMSAFNSACIDPTSFNEMSSSFLRLIVPFQMFPEAMPIILRAIFELYSNQQVLLETKTLNTSLLNEP
jgi:hypothetical protein